MKEFKQNILDTFKKGVGIKFENNVNMIEENVRTHLLQVISEEKPPVMLFTSSYSSNPNINSRMYWNGKEQNWHLWPSPRSAPWDDFEKGFVKPDFIFGRGDRLYVVELKSCWQKFVNDEGAYYSYCLDNSEELRSGEETYIERDKYSIVKCTSTDQWLERAREQSGNNACLLEKIIAEEPTMENLKVSSYAVVCIIDFKEREIVDFQG